MNDTISAMKPFWKNPVFPAVAIVLVAMVSYIPAMRAAQIWDDDTLVLDNELMQARDGLYRYWFTTEGVDYCPVTWSSLWLEWRLWGDRPAGYHVTNILLHAFSSIVLWLVLRQLGLPGAWLAAMVFAVHPVNVASVAWITERKNTMSMPFALLTILCYLKFDSQASRRWYAAACVMFIFALLSKSSTVVVPAVLTACIWWRRGGLTLRTALPIVPLFMLAGVVSVATIWFQQHNAIGDTVVRTSDGLSRLATAGWAFWFYVVKALVPYNLCMVYPRWQVDGHVLLSHLPGLTLIASMAIFWTFRKGWARAPFFALITFLIGISPVLGLFDMYWYLYSFVADHWQYIPIISIVAFVICGGASCCRDRPRWVVRLAVAVAILLVALFGAMTWKRASTFEDQSTLWTDTIQRNPSAWIAYYNLACVHQLDGEPDRAIPLLTKSIEIKPDYHKSHVNLGIILAARGDLVRAMDCYREAIRLAPAAAPAHYNMGSVLIRLGKLDAAADCYLKALERDPENPRIHNDAGVVLYNQEKFDQAVHHFTHAVDGCPDDAEMRLNLGNAMARQDRLDEAIAQYREAIRLKPDYAFAYNNLGFALANKGLIDEAIGYYRQALRIDPDYHAARRNLSMAMEKKDRLPR